MIEDNRTFLHCNYKITMGNWKEFYNIRLIKTQTLQQDNGKSKLGELYKISHNFEQSVFSHLPLSNNNKSNTEKADW